MAIKQFYNGLNIYDVVDKKIYNDIIVYYDIKDCIKIILSNGNLYDAHIRYINNYPFKLNNTNNNIYEETLNFHRKIACSYIKELIHTKINNRILEFLKFEEFIKNENFDKTCSICLETVNDCKNDNWFISKCNHLFHKKCISKWTKNTCPLCRKRNYK